MKFFNTHLKNKDITKYALAIINKSVDELPDSMLNHVNECDKCAVKILRQRKLLKQKPDVEKFSKKEILRKRIYIFSSVAALLIAIISIIYFFPNNEKINIAKKILQKEKFYSNKKKKSFVLDTINKTNTHKKYLADNSLNEKKEFEKIYLHDKKLDKKLGYQKLKSGEKIFSLISPKLEENYKSGKKIIISWETEINGKIEVVVKKKLKKQFAEEYLKNITIDKKISLDNLEKGRYYFIIFSNNTPLYIGVFLVGH